MTELEQDYISYIIDTCGIDKTFENNSQEQLDTVIRYIEDMKYDIIDMEITCQFYLHKSSNLMMYGKGWKIVEEDNSFVLSNGDGLREDFNTLKEALLYTKKM